MDKTKQKIIQVAMHMIAEQGYKSTTTSAIAKRAGVSEVTIFRKFGNKKGIVVEAFQETKWYAQLGEILEDKCIGDPAYDLKAYAKAYIDLFSDYSVRCMLNLSREGFLELQAILQNVPQSLINPLKNYFQKMQDEGKLRKGDATWQAKSFVIELFGMVISETIWEELEQNQKEREEYLSNLIALYLN